MRYLIAFIIILNVLYIWIDVSLYLLFFNDIDLHFLRNYSYAYSYNKSLAESLFHFALILSIPHITFLASKYFDIIDIEAETVNFIFEILYIILGSFVVLAWCYHPELDRAEPMILAIGISFTTFEYLKVLLFKATKIFTLWRK